MSSLNAPKIIASPEAQKLQAERVNLALYEKEKACLEKIQNLLAEEGCQINPRITLTATGIIDAGYSIVANERFQR
jgi:hypothetical protein